MGLQESLRFWWIASGILSFTQYIVISLCPPDSDMLKTMNDSRGQMILSSCCDCFPVWHSSELVEKYGLPSYPTCRAALPLNNYSFEESATCHPFIGLDPSKRWGVMQYMNYFDTHETKLPYKYGCPPYWLWQSQSVLKEESSALPEKQLWVAWGDQWFWAHPWPYWLHHIPRYY